MPSAPPIISYYAFRASKDFYRAVSHELYASPCQHDSDTMTRAAVTYSMSESRYYFPEKSLRRLHCHYRKWCCQFPSFTTEVSANMVWNFAFRYHADISYDGDEYRYTSCTERVLCFASDDDIWQSSPLPHGRWLMPLAPPHVRYPYFSITSRLVRHGSASLGYYGIDET